MKRVSGFYAKHSRFYLLTVMLIVCLADSLFAQVDKRHETYSELDIWIRTHPDEQIYIFAPFMKSLDDSYSEAGVGAMYSWSYDQNNLSMFDWMVTRENLENFRNFTARIGLYYGQSLGDSGLGYKEVMLPAELHIRRRIGEGFLLTDRNRIELHSRKDNDNSWNYRNRLTFERQFSLFGSLRMTPYITAEVGFDSRYDTFNRSRFTGGSKVSVISQIMIDVYYAFVNDTRSSVHQKHGIGLTVNLYIEPKDIFN